MMAKHKWLRWVIAALILLTLGFIWSNSARDAAASAAQSDAAGKWIEHLFDITREPFRFLYDNRRKVAHFAEFALLGAETALWVRLYGKHTLPRLAYGLGFCVAVGAVDECIQMLSAGRVASFWDVCLDSCGALFGILLCLSIFALCRIFAKK